MTISGEYYAVLGTPEELADAAVQIRAAGMIEKHHYANADCLFIGGGFMWGRGHSSLIRSYQERIQLPIDQARLDAVLAKHASLLSQA